MNPAIFSTRARREFNKALRDVAEENPTSARALKETVEHVARNLGEYPQMGVERPTVATAPTRFFPLTGFRYVLVYDPALKPPVILRFLHESRDIYGLLENLR